MRKRAGRAVWEQRIATCMASGLSCRDWARENGFVYQTVLLWKRKLQEKTPQNEPAFVELVDSDSHSSGIYLMIDEIKIVIEKNFDLTALSECIRVVRIACSR